MNSDSLVFALLFGAAIWMILRLRSKVRGQVPRRAAAAPTGAAHEPSTMPRLGRPGTMTREQGKALAQVGIHAPRGWSSEEAALLLDAVDYQRLACRGVPGLEAAEAPLEIQTALLHFVLGREELREQVRQWGAARRAGNGGEEALPDTPELAATVAEAARLLQSAPDGAHGSRGSRAQPGQRVQRTQN
jgi:hypothetical protein